MSALLELNSWASFRDSCFTQKNLNNQYTEDADGYDLYGPDSNNLTWHIRILKNGESDEFESTYKSQCNFAIGTRPHAFAAPDFTFEGDGIYFVATAGGSTQSDMKIATASDPGLYINGGSLFTSGAILGDWVEIQIVDVDGIVGTPGAIVGGWVKKWFVSPLGNQTAATPYAQKISGGLYVRLIYHSTGLTNVKIALNLSLHLEL